VVHARCLNPAECGITSELDLQQCPLFPVVKPSELEPRFAEWLFAAAPEANVEFATCWRALPASLRARHFRVRERPAASMRNVPCCARSA